jgi:hypothetical protein
MKTEQLAPRIPVHHRIQVSGTLGRQEGQPQANPIFQIETLADDGVAWSRLATGYSTMAGVHNALRTCKCIRCELASINRRITRLERDTRILQALAANSTAIVSTRRRRPKVKP